MKEWRVVMQEFKLPDLGEGMQEAEIRCWLVQPGDMVKLDQPMLEVETDKAVVEIPAPIAGRVRTLHVEEGTVARLGELLVTFDTTGDQPAVREQTQSAADQWTGGVSSGRQAGTEYAVGQRVLAAPAVRKRAFELNIDLKQVPSSHPTGRVTLDDLQQYAEHVQSAPASPAPVSQKPASLPSNGTKATNGHRTAEPSPAILPSEERQPLTGLRRRIAEHMELSWRTIPHATAFDELDGTELIALRQQLKPIAEERGVTLSYMPLLIKLLIPVLEEFPIFNASLDEERREVIYKRNYHIGIAADSPEGLLVPVLRHADQLSILQIAERLRHLIAGAQKRTLSLNELAGSTFTLNNIGSFGGSRGTPIINYPEVAILAVGRLQEQAIVRNGAIVACSMMPLALSFDHRVIDGALAGRFLSRFKALIEHPQQLLLDLK
jgi:pyruvate dehydrogenase E2 component (dihydrolipoamide acetyltransferase)